MLNNCYFTRVVYFSYVDLYLRLLVRQRHICAKSNDYLTSSRTQLNSRTWCE